MPRSRDLRASQSSNSSRRTIRKPGLPRYAAICLLAGFVWLGFAGTLGIIYGALVSMAQKDLKKLVAYSSVSHMGYCMLGIASLTTLGISGCLFQMFSHGVITGALFLLVGVLYDRAHTREIAAFGGLGVKVPKYTGIFMLFAMASLGLPSMSGFVSEFMVFVGSYKSLFVSKWIVVLAVLGVVFTAGYILRMVQKVFLGQFNTKWEGLTEINGREIFCKGANWVGPGIFPGQVTTDTYSALLGLAKDAHDTKGVLTYAIGMLGSNQAQLDKVKEDIAALARAHR